MRSRLPKSSGNRPVIGLSICGAAGLMGYAVRGRSSSMFGPSVYRGTPTRRAIALTFDDGPSESTPEILDILDRYHAPATFFQCGANIRRLPRIANDVRRVGHEIGNHGDSHRLSCFQAPGVIFNEFQRAQDTMEDLLHITPKLMRAPFGVRWFGFREMQRRLNLLGVMWSVMSKDWSLAAPAIVERVLRAAGNGAIVCLHDGRELRPNPDIAATVEAVRMLVPELASRGYHFETVSQILCPKN